MRYKFYVFIYHKFIGGEKKHMMYNMGCVFMGR